MVLFCLCLGSQQIVLKATSAAAAPVLQLALRSGAAAVLVGLYMLWRRERPDFRDGNWKPGLLVGVLFALEFLLVGEALRLTAASHVVVFLYTAPLFTALVLHFMIASERLSAGQWGGILVAFAGLAGAFLGRTDTASAAPGSVVGDLLALLAGLAWGLSTVLIRTTALARISPNQTLQYQLVAAFVLLLPAAGLLDQWAFTPTPSLLLGLLFQTLVVSFAAFLIWYWLLRHYQVSRIGVLAFMTPMFGVMLGVWWLDELLEPAFLWGALALVLGILLVSGPDWRRTRAGAKQTGG